MKPVRATLIALFSRLSCEEIEADTSEIVRTFDADSFESVAAAPGYADEYSRVRAAKRTIERIGANYSPTNGDQALQCLCLLHELRAPTVYVSNDFAVTRDLIASTLYPGWSAPNRQSYDERRNVLEEWADVFLSYTNRDANAINNRYRTLISEELGWPGKSEIAMHNYVARVVAKYFEQQNLRGFVDFKSLKCGDEIEDGILRYCHSSIAFVQLVEGVVLSEPPPTKVNWCHTEYIEFAKAAFPMAAGPPKVNRQFFVLAGSAQLQSPAALGKAYQPWFQQISADLHLVLDSHNAKPWDNLKNEVRAIALQVVDARAKLVDSMLATWQ